jgi:hypothetical protein
MYILVHNLIMRELSITEFRRQCLSLLEDLPEEGLVITKHGPPVARVLRVRPMRKGERVTLPLLKGKGRPGPLRPNTETPYELILD